MSRWSILLSGDQAALKHLVAIYDAGPLLVRRRADDFILDASAFDTCDTPECVSSIAERLVGLIAGAVDLTGYGSPDVSLGAVIGTVHGVQSGTHVLRPDNVSHRHYASDVSLADSTHDTATLPVARRWVTTALADNSAEKVLRLLSREPRTWGDLYRIFELIERRAGSTMYEQGWTSRNAAERFARSANSPQVSGDDARHAYDRTDPPPNPMSIDDAQQFVRHLARQWLDTLAL